MFRAVQVVLIMAGFVVSGYELYLDRRIAAVEFNAAMIEMVSDPNTPSAAKRTALVNLAGCDALEGHDFAPEGVEPGLGCWTKGAKFAKARFGPYAGDHRLLCAGRIGLGVVESLTDIVSGGGEPPKTTIRGSDFSCANMQDVYLGDAEIFDSRLNGVRFLNAELPRTRWVEAELKEVDFTKADLSGAIFKGSDVLLSGAVFNNANLSGAQFLDQVKLDGASFLQADVSGADFSAAARLDATRIRRACIREESLRPKLPPGDRFARIKFPQCAASAD